MGSYWYLTRDKKIPRNRKLISVTRRTRYMILQFSYEVDCDKVRECELNYLGCGNFNDYEIQVALMREIQKNI